MFEEQYDLFGDFQPDFDASDFDDIFEAGDVGFRYVMTDDNEKGVIISMLDTFGDVADHFFTVDALKVFNQRISDLTDLLTEDGDEA